MPAPKPTPHVFGDPQGKSFWQDDRTRLLMAAIALLAFGIGALILKR